MGILVITVRIEATKIHVSLVNRPLTRTKDEQDTVFVEWPPFADFGEAYAFAVGLLQTRINDYPIAVEIEVQGIDQAAREKGEQAGRDLVKERGDEFPKKTAGGGGVTCFVATACYGDLYAPEVETLRQWRDTTLASSALGRLVIHLYYTGAGQVGAWFLRIFPSLKPLVRQLLNLFIKKISVS